MTVVTYITSLCVYAFSTRHMFFFVFRETRVIHWLFFRPRCASCKRGRRRASFCAFDDVVDPLWRPKGSSPLIRDHCFLTSNCLTAFSISSRTYMHTIFSGKSCGITDLARFGRSPLRRLPTCSGRRRHRWICSTLHIPRRRTDTRRGLCTLSLRSRERKCVVAVFAFARVSFDVPAS